MLSARAKMLNLLRYRGQAEYPADFEAAACTGREAYGRYGELVMPLIGNYQAAKPHRTAGLEDSRLIESTTAFGLGSE